MGILHIATIAAISLTSLIPASCRKTAVKTSTSASVAAATTTNTAHELGELTLTNHLETCVHLGSGKSC
jgi:ABC-type enterochelin transport system substrate-binding protein